MIRKKYQSIFNMFTKYLAIEGRRVQLRTEVAGSER